MTDEVIGGVGITISGDFSDLDAQFQAAVAKAQSEGASLAQAIQSALRPPDTAGLTGAIDLVGEASIRTGIALDTLSQKVQAALENGTAASTTEAITQAIIELGSSTEGAAAAMAPLAAATAAMGDAATNADAGIKQLGQDSEHAAESAHAAEGGFAGMAEQLVRFGEALAVTEALKELGLEALTAADNVTRATIALTAITGSGTEAKETIEGLEKLGISDGLSFPALLTAGTRMQQLLPEGTDVAAVLAKIADGAAVMGTDINAAATKFDLLATSGNISGKSLLSLGLNMQMIADAMNRVNPALNATAETAKGLFKVGGPFDDEGRIKVLETALEGLAGTAQKVAESTFGGQWQILANQWDAVMVEAGKALMPVIKELTDLMKVDVLPFLKDLVADFNQLPAPVKDVSVALGLAVAALAPLAVGVGGLGLAISGMSAALPALEAVGAALATFATESLPAAIEGLTTFAMVTLPAAVSGAAAFATALVSDAAAAITTFATVAVPAAIESLGILITTTIPAAVAGFGTLAGEAITSAGAGFISFATNAVSAVASALTSMVSGAIPLAIGALSALGIAVAGAAAAFAGFELGKWLYNNVTAFKSFGDAVAGAIISIESWMAQSHIMAEVMASMGDATAKANLAMIAEGEQASALSKKLADHGVVIQQGNLSLDAWIEKMYSAAANLGKTGTAVDGLSHSMSLAQATTEANAISMQKLSDAVGAAQQKLINAVSAYDQLKASGTASSDALAAAAENVAKAQDAVSQATSQLSKVQSDGIEKTRNLASATRDFVDISKTYVDEENTAALAEQAHMDKITALSQSVVHAQQLYQSMLDAFSNGTRTMGDVEKAAASLQKQIDALNKAVGDAPKVQFFNAEQKQQLTDEQKSLSDVLSIVSDMPAPISAANKVMIDFGITNANTGASFKQLKTDADTLIGDLPALDAMFASGAISQADYDKALGNLSKDLQQMAKVDLPAYVAELGKIAQTQIDAHQSNTVVMTDLAAYSAGIQKLASVDLPAAIAAEGNYIKLLIQNGATQGQILDAEAAAMQMEIKDAEQRGQDANDWVLGLEKVRLEQEALRLSSHGLADEYVAMINDVLKGFDAMAGVMADAIVNGKNLGQALVGEFKKIAQSILTDVIQMAMLPLKQALLEMIGGLLPGMSGALGVVGGSLGGMNAAAGLASTGLRDLAAASQQAAASISAGVGNPASSDKQGSGIAGAMSNLASTLNVITGIISAGAAVAETIILSHISSDTGHIEVNTRETFAQITNIWETLKSDFTQTYDRMGEMLDRLNHIMDSTAAIAAAGGTGGAMSPDSLNALTMDGEKTVTILGNTYSLTQSILAAVQSMANDTAWIMHDADTTAQNVAVMANELNEIYDVLLYGKSFSASSESAAASQRSAQSISLNALVSHAATAATQRTAQGQALNSLVTQSIMGNNQGRQIVDNTGAGADATDSLYAPLQAQANAAAIAARQASGQLGELEQLRTELMAYEQMANIAHEQGNEALATQYTLAAQKIQAQIALVAPQVNAALVSAYEATDMSLVNASKGVEFATLSSANLISSTVAQSGLFIANAVASAAVNNTAASAQFATALTQSLINIRGSNSSATPSQTLPRADGAATPVSVAHPDNTGAHPLPITGHMGFATGGSIQTDQVAQLHAGEVVLPAVQVAAQAAQMTAQAQQISQLQADLAGQNITLQQALASGDVGASNTALRGLNDLQARLDALTQATTANTTATQADSGVSSASGGTQDPAALQSQMVALMQQQLAAQNELAVAQKTGNAAIVQVSQDKLDQINGQMASLKDQQAMAMAAQQGGQSSSGIIGASPDTSSASDILQRQLAQSQTSGNDAMAALMQDKLNVGSMSTTDLSSSADSSNSDLSGFDFSGLSSGGGSMDTSGIIAAIQEGTATLDADLHQVSVEIMSLAAHIGGASAVSAIAGAQKWGVATPKSFDVGGFVDQDQLAMVHAGEFVVPPDITGMLRNMVSVPRTGYGMDSGGSGGRGGGGGGNVIVNAPITITGVTNAKQLVDMIGDRLKTVIPRTGKYTT
jgi:hypothetical protein